MIKWCVHHRSIVVLVCVMITIFGAGVFSGLERQENPSVTAPIATVQCVYGGAGPEDVERDIIKPLEKELARLNGVKTLESYAMDSVGVVKVTLEDMSDSEIQNMWTKLREKVDSAKTSFPEAASEPVVNTDLTESYGVVLGLTSSDYTYENLWDVAEVLERKLSRIDGVAAVDITGMVNQQITVELDMVRLNQYGLTPNDIGTAIAARNISIPGGSLHLGGHKVPVQISGEYETVEELRDTIVGVSAETGLPVYLRNVARVAQEEEADAVHSQVNGEKALLVGVRYADQQNVVRLGKQITKALEEFQQHELYENMSLIVITDQAVYVDEAISLFNSNLLMAIVLVVAVVGISMGLRSALVVSAPIAVVICTVILAMWCMAIPLHQVSIASLILSLSLLVANGIVANDNITLYLERGEGIDAACTKGVSEVSVAILTSTLTTIASFLPLAMMQGVAGKFARSLPVLVSVALIASFITSLTLVPAFAKWLVEKKNVLGKKERSQRVQKVKSADGRAKKVNLKWLTEFYLGWLKRSLKAPLRTVLAFVLVLAVSGLLVPGMGLKIFPKIERDQYVISVALPDSSGLDTTSAKAAVVADILGRDEAVGDFAAVVGDGFMRYYITFSPASQGTGQMEFLVNGSREEAQMLAEQIEEAVPASTTKVKYLEYNQPQEYEIQLRVSGDDISELRRIAEELTELTANVEGIRHIESNYGYDSYKLTVKVNEEKANLVGITNYDVASTVRMAVNGTEISSLAQDDEQREAVPIIMQISREYEDGQDALYDVYLTSQVTGETVPLRQIARLETESTLNKIVRRDQQRTLTVGITLQEDYSATAVLNHVKGALADYSLPSGYQLEYGGENEFANEVLGSMVTPALLAAALIYLILALEFGHLKEPLIIMGTIPLSFIGIIWGLYIMGYPIGFMALLGAISLMGVVVNNGIVLLDCIKMLDGQYESLTDAVVEACRIRMRPILIGMVTTVISLVPMVISGGDLWAPLATSIMFGMFFSTILTLIVVPSAYMLIHRERAAG